MFKNGRPGAWLLLGLIASVLLRGPIYLLTWLYVGPLLGPVDGLLLRADNQTAATAVWVGDAVASLLVVVATGVTCLGLGEDRLWAYRLGRALAWFYIAVNTVTAAACGTLPSAWGLLTPALLALYVGSIAVAVVVLRQLATHRRSATVTGIIALRRLNSRRDVPERQ
ncbi:hypothetical protein GCM10010532_039100 [Dactylosporangium siamense]|uniref:Uncharacterized protein n=1 Tax=Dactylosporangium siamense TaxID=685454 RepID=A0A919PUX6_9ACTN|nr:hypothetical protein Dsi01nite_077870 [Dactylosporangium siamense]